MEVFSLTLNILVVKSLSNQLQNPQDKQISKLSLVVRFDVELVEISRIKENTSIFELSSFILSQVYRTDYRDAIASKNNAFQKLSSTGSCAFFMCTFKCTFCAKDLSQTVQLNGLKP